MFSTIRRLLTLRSITARLRFWYVLTLAVALLGFASFIWLAQARTLYNELDAALEIRGLEIASQLRPALLELDLASKLADDPLAPGLPIIVRASRGAVIYRAPVFPLIPLAAERDLALAARESPGELVTVRDRSSGQLRVTTLWVERPGTEPLAVQVAAPHAPVQDELRRLALTMAVAILLVLAVASYGSGVTARHALAPVDALVSRVGEIQAAGLRERLEVRGGSVELDRLVSTLNAMLDRIDVSMRSARRFAADASHELQTPLTAMRAVVEASLKESQETRDGSTEAALLDEIERCSFLVRDLRLLALAQAGQVVAAREPVDMVDLASQCCEIARALGEAKQIGVDFHAEGRPVVSGAVLHLRRVILNLATNAIAYSEAGSTVRIEVANRGDLAAVSVGDTGSGIEPGDLPHIFEAFYRSDPARARDTGGSGLGLAIAEEIVRAHGGRIQVDSTPGRGSTFTVSLPSLPGPASERARTGRPTRASAK